MPTKIRLQRHGKKRSAFYHIVIADNRAPRDGKFIEKIGTYNPNTNPATIDLQFDKALDWVQTGAQPTETVRAILSYEGVLYKNHLDIGVRKGAFSEDEAIKRFEAWKQEKMNKIQKKVETLDKAKVESYNSRIKAEKDVSSKREQEILAKSSALAEEAQKAAEAAAATQEAEKVSAETPVAEAAEEAPKAEAAETPAAEAAEEAPKAESTETPAAEAAEEAPKAESTETPAAEAAEEAPKAESTETPAAEAAEEAPKAETTEEKKEDDSEKPA